jgi:hypothetical protein
MKTADPYMYELKVYEKCDPHDIDADHQKQRHESNKPIKSLINTFNNKPIVSNVSVLHTV